MRQLRLIPSGVQTVYRETIAATNDVFAYSSTMALHFYNLKDCMLYKMIGAHERSITAIVFSPEDSNLLASCSSDCKMAIWSLDTEEEHKSYKDSSVAVLLDWGLGNKIAVALENGDVKLWEWEADKQTKLFSVGKEAAKVVRWHPWSRGKLLCGVADGSVIFYDMAGAKPKQTTLIGKSKTTKDAVSDAQWDPLSESFCLVAFKDGGMSLYDASTLQELTVFDKQPQGIRSIAFVRSQPGNFLTVSDRIGVIKVWNVSQGDRPQTQMKVGQSGVNCIKAFPNEPDQFVLSFKNSSVGIVDILHRRVRFMSAPGHSETIFDCAFHPEDPDLLATASYDGYVKLWRISTGHHEREFFTEKDQLLYGLSFGPGATHICACSSIGNLFIWKIDNGKLLSRTQVHAGQAYRVEWNLKRRHDFGGEIATGGNDGFACVTDAATGQVIQRMHHPDSVVGVSWHAFHNGILATGCKDGGVRLWNTAVPSEGAELQFLFKGHEARVFNVAFHPICPNLLASGSDDKTVRVWNWCPSGIADNSREVRRLVGHTAYVRALLWHTELPGILFSGAWDSTIRVWDVTNQRCLHVCYEHYADVYGLTLHPQRPFFLVSSSRDTTLRFWIFEDYARALLVSAVVRPSRIAELLGGGPEEAMAFLTASPGSVMLPPLRLYGQVSRQLASSVQEDLSKHQLVQVYQKIICFFMYRSGLEDVWGMLSAIRGESTVGASAGRTFFHEQELIACQKSKALELASQRAQIGVAGKHEDRLLKAAQVMLRIGDIRSYCRFTAQAGQWERAICVAPAVSRQFWQELCAEYIETLAATTDLDEVAPFMVVSGQQARLTDALIERGDLDNAFVVAKADYDNLLPKREPPQPLIPGQGVVETHGDRARLEEVAAQLARRHASMGEPVQAALCYLAISAGSRAVHALSRAHEVVLAYVVAELLSLPKEPIVLKLLANCAEKDNRWDLAADVWRQHPRGLEIHIPLLAARATDKVAAQSWSPWTQQQHQEMLDQCRASGNRAGMVLHEVCLNQRQQAAQDGVESLHELFRNPGGWQLAQAREILDALEALPLQDMPVKDIAGVLSCAAYVALVEASSLGYHELMFPLAQTLRNIISHQFLSFPASVGEISLIEATTAAHWKPEKALEILNTAVVDPNTPANIRAACEQQMASIRERSSFVLSWDSQDFDKPGLTKLAGGHLPSCYRRYAKTSVLTNELIRGPAFTLEDMKSHISVTDALAWARVNAFSPLNTGCKIQPV
mmetsp:Transcript_83429/g.131776  ORF Transcript_83429/g.131776 Transcript_83429/m.131776 type:complete len:1252 (+) Transcript_83429:88-3843(+)